jgi:DNA-binding transcriptional LysR family regulator
MAAGSDAVAVAPMRVAVALARRFGLSIHDLPRPLPPIRLFAVSRPGRDPPVDWLVELVRRCMSDA